jgi:hypothetical protein
MKHFRNYYVAVALPGVIVAIVLEITYGANASVVLSTATPVSIAISNSGSSDDAAIKDVIVRSYSVRADALTSGDISQFPTVFINDPSVPLKAENADFLKKVRDRYGNAVQPITGDGLLAYESAKVLDRHQNLAPFQHIEATAKAEGRILTPQELRSVTQVDGNPPAAIVKGGQANVVLTNVVINGNHAVVTYETSATTSRATLVNTASGWRIAGLETLKVHI